MEISRKVAENLLKIKAVFLRPDEPFTWASGIKSPIYCDNRLILTSPEARNVVENAIAETVKKEYLSDNLRLQMNLICHFAYIVGTLQKMFIKF